MTRPAPARWRHPFERLSTRAVRAGALGLLAAWLLLTVLLAGMVPGAHAAQLVRLLRAESADEASAVVGAWPPEVRVTAGFVIGFDFLYDLVHDNAVALLCVWGARALGGPRVALAARAVAWTMWLDVLLNIAENFGALQIVRHGATARWFSVVTTITSVRFVTLWGGFAFGVATLIAARWRAPMTPR